MVVSSRMFPNRYMGNGMEITKHPFKTGCLEFQVMTSQPNPPGNVPSPRNKALWSELINHWFSLRPHCGKLLFLTTHCRLWSIWLITWVGLAGALDWLQLSSNGWVDWWVQPRFRIWVLLAGQLQCNMFPRRDSWTAWGSWRPSTLRSLRMGSGRSQHPLQRWWDLHELLAGHWIPTIYATQWYEGLSMLVLGCYPWLKSKMSLFFWRHQQGRFASGIADLGKETALSLNYCLTDLLLDWTSTWPNSQPVLANSAGDLFGKLGDHFKG